MAEEKVAKKAATKEPAAKSTASDSSGFKGEYWYANGKRKTSVARVRLYKGSGKIIVNKKPVDDFVKAATHTEEITLPLRMTGTNRDFDISAQVVGGGSHAQAEAVRHGIAKALVLFDENLRGTLKKAGLLTRDSRSKERKKFGLKRARRAPQWAKR
jgi:small subunit ribosomal protein S9